MKNFPSFLEYLNTKNKIEKVKINPKADNVDMPKPKAKEDPHRKNKTPKKHAQVKEYLDFKGKVVEKPDTEEVSDYKGPQPTAPEEKGAAPYKAANDTQPAKKELEKGLGELGNKELVYEPDTKNSVKITKTEQFVNKTKNMSLSEFTQYMLKECGCGMVNDEEIPYVTAYTTGKFQPHPPEAVKYVVVLANKNNNILDNMVHEMKSSGSLGKLLKAILNHPEAYDELNSLLADDKDGPGRCNSFAKSMYGSYAKFLDDQKNMYESVSAPVGFEDEEMDMDDEEEDYDDEEMDMDDEEEGYDDEEMDMDDEEEDYDDEEMDMGDKESHEGDMDLDLEKEKKPKKLKKKFAHDYLADAMKKYEPLKKAMRWE
jgi:hypothetical protein